MFSHATCQSLVPRCRNPQVLSAAQIGVRGDATLWFTGKIECPPRVHARTWAYIIHRDSRARLCNLIQSPADEIGGFPGQGVELIRLGKTHGHGGLDRDSPFRDPSAASA